ncbi:hypothetical protein PGT21_022582 [Puccinia graminis f. sp. tritici]|uniref:Uncharacterized protein n=1 Tax=Puccinia graminis f. sp. tritici TaxID=56615 RepID=A0A5B0LP33_PUCGR|nr:hypothetical protein PGTUg99_014453 [Puccinia graminis f. sp. tritici]KAA1071909.1 hypothetical protein PGT21_022582 [Puccinia graminis f. sp. tritici]
MASQSPIQDTISIPDSDIDQTTALNAQVRQMKEAHGIADCPANVQANDRLPEAEPGAYSFGAADPAGSAPAQACDASQSIPPGIIPSTAPSIPVPQTPDNSINLSVSTNYRTPTASNTEKHYGSTVDGRSTNPHAVTWYKQDDDASNPSGPGLHGQFSEAQEEIERQAVAHAIRMMFPEPN